MGYKGRQNFEEELVAEENDPKGTPGVCVGKGWLGSNIKPTINVIKCDPRQYKSELKSLIPSDAKSRKDCPIGTGVLDYFPNAIFEVAKVSKIGNDQHNPGEPLHWAKEKSQDEEDAMMRHYTQRFDDDSDGAMHAAKMCWRALAFLQKLCEARALGMSYQEYNKYLKDKK